MFEDQRRKRAPYYAAMFFMVFLVLVSFSIGYFLNNKPDDSMIKEQASAKANYHIPEEVTRPTDNAAENQDISGTQENEVPATAVNDRISKDTLLSFKTYYALCGHILEKQVKLPDNLINVNRETIMRNYPDWQVLGFSNDEIILRKDMPTLCPNHFVIGSLEGNVAIFTYDESGEKVLKERTDIPISTLTPEDQANLDNGIIADTQDDLDQKLDGLSN